MYEYDLYDYLCKNNYKTHTFSGYCGSNYLKNQIKENINNNNLLFYVTKIKENFKRDGFRKIGYTGYKSNGHFVLIKGYIQLKNGNFYLIINDPMSYWEKQGESRIIPLEDFMSGISSKTGRIFCVNVK